MMNSMFLQRWPIICFYLEHVWKGMRCDFEQGFCGWINTANDDLDWTRHNGSTPTHFTGPSHDHTYKNSTGIYAFVDMSETQDMGNSAILQSPRFPPPPKYHSNIASPYFNSCQVRAFCISKAVLRLN